MATESAQRTNERWLAELVDPGPAGAQAQGDLRSLVAAAVRRTTEGGGPLDEATREDLTQVAVLRVLENLERFEGRSRFTTWAWAVAVRAAFSELRRARYREAPEDLDAARDLATGEPQPVRWAERNEIVEVMQRVIAEELTERQRTAILGELSGRPQGELLDELGIQRNALYKLVHDARRKLRAGLGAAGICDDQVREAFDL